MLPDSEPVYIKPFIHLLHGSVNLAQLAELEERSYRPNTLAHSSILNSSLMLEAAANCCIESMSVTRKLKDDLDRLPTIAKFETFARIEFSKRKSDIFDPSDPILLQVRELKTLRDRLVHPKLMTGELIWTEWDGEGNGEAYEEYGRYPNLDISRDPSTWRREDAFRVSRAANSFLDYLFRQKLRYSVSATHSILLGKVGDHTSVFDFDCISESLEITSREQKIPLAYLGITKDANKSVEATG